MAHQLHITRTRCVKCTSPNTNFSITLMEPFVRIHHPTDEDVEAHYLERAREQLANGYTNVQIVTQVTTWKGANGKRTTSYEDIVPVE